MGWDGEVDGQKNSMKTLLDGELCPDRVGWLHKSIITNEIHRSIYKEKLSVWRSGRNQNKLWFRLGFV